MLTAKQELGMTLEPHPHIKSTSAEFELVPDGNVRPVVTIYTDLELSNLADGFDEAALMDLIEHIQRWQKVYSQQVRLKKG
jgi:hypothetical protein